MWRTPLAGGTPTQLTRTYAREPVLSPDGSLIAYSFPEPGPAQAWKIAVMPAAGGPPIKVLTRRPGDYRSFELQWTPDGRGITYEVTENGVRQAAGRRARRLRHRHRPLFAAALTSI